MEVAIRARNLFLAFIEAVMASKEVDERMRWADDLTVGHG